MSRWVFLLPLLFWDVMLQTSINLDDEERFLNDSFKNLELLEYQELYHAVGHCNHTILVDLYNKLLDFFREHMMELNEESWCDWSQVIRPYLYLSEYIMEFTTNVNCIYPNPIAEKLFLKVHRHYFQQCLQQEEGFPDAPHEVVVTLTLIPIILIPIFVFLVVMKNTDCRN